MHNKIVYSFCAFTLLSLSLVFADLRYRGNAVHPDYPGQCYYEELQQPIPKTQSIKPVNIADQCVSVYCRTDYVLEIEYCGRHNLIPNETCKIVSDIRFPFPECCPGLSCEADNNYI